MSNKTNILIKQLILVGYRKDYIVPFNPGVNIIYGDSTTGKSSILELINYSLGASKFDTYDEIEAAVRYVALELELNNKPYVIKRDIFNPKKLVEVYETSYINIDKVYPDLYAPFYGLEKGPAGYLSDFLLDSMELPNLKIRRAPTKVESKIVQLSFRDIFKFCYLNQEDVGSTHLLDNSNWPVYTKNKQTFKYLFNLLDSTITDLEQELSELSYVKKQLENKYVSVAEFLRDTEFSSLEEIHHSSDELDEKIEILESQLQDISQHMVANSDRYHTLKDIINTINLNIKKRENEKFESEHAIERYSRLKNDYLNDIEKLKSAKLAKEIIGGTDGNLTVCPICSNDFDINSIRLNFQISDNDKVNHEMNTLRRRVKELENIIQNEKNKYKNSNLELFGFNSELDQARQMLDEESNSMITPYISERDGILSNLATLMEKRNQTDITLKIRNQEEKIHSAIVKTQGKIDSLNKNLEELQENAPSLSSVLDTLSIMLDEYLEKINIKNRRNINISQSTFLPIIGEKNYVNITSGGLRTITSLGYFIGLLKYSLYNEMNFPHLLMIDTVGKYLGKTDGKYAVETDEDEDKKENISDPSKYKNIYEYMIDVCEIAEKDGKSCQIILVDNDVPPSIQKEYAGFVVAHYSSSGESGLPIGLIDDADIVL